MHDLSLFNSHPHKEDDVYVKGDIICISFSTHILTRRMTKPSTVNVRNIIFSTHILTRRMTTLSFHLHNYNVLFNSHPHKEDDYDPSAYCADLDIFNSHPHKEDDATSGSLRLWEVYFQLTSSQGG